MDTFGKWLDKILEEKMPEEGIAACFNLYEDENNGWSVQFIVADAFDKTDDDWACEEVYSTGEDNYTWKQEGSWEEIETVVMEWVKQYFISGKYAQVLKDFQGVAVGFVDGTLNLVS